jgi:hypothetical protein
MYLLLCDLRYVAKTLLFATTVTGPYGGRIRTPRGRIWAHKWASHGPMWGTTWADFVSRIHPYVSPIYGHYRAHAGPHVERSSDLRPAGEAELRRLNHVAWAQILDEPLHETHTRQHANTSQVAHDTCMEPRGNTCIIITYNRWLHRRHAHCVF